MREIKKKTHIGALLFWGMLVGVALIVPATPVLASSADLFPPSDYFVGKILTIESGRQEELLGAVQQFLNITVLIKSGAQRGEEIVIEDEDRFAGDTSRGPQPGDTVVIAKVWDSESDYMYRIEDYYRLPALGFIFLLFLGLVIFFGRRKGIGAIAGLSVSILTLRYYVIPHLISGDSPTFTLLIGAFLIAICSLVLAHGFVRRTYVALGSTLITLFISILLADFFVVAARLLGMGSEEAFFLQATGPINFDLRGLLLGGIIIGMLGILDDVTTAQTAAVEEISRANPSLPSRELYQRGLSVGTEHIASLVNTLVLAYVGASLPLFLLFTINSAQLPAWVLINSEFIAEEVVRALAGSVALVLAVPISTFIASRFFGRRS